MARPPAPAPGEVARASRRPAGFPRSGVSRVARATCALGTALLGLALLAAGSVTRADAPVTTQLVPPAQAVPPLVAPPKAGVVTRTSEAGRAPGSFTSLGPFSGNPFAQHRPWTDPETPAAQSVSSAEGRDAELLSRLARVPTATWLLPEDHPLGVVGERVREVVERAHAQNEVPVLVVYGVPGRDCVAGESVGGLPPEEYRDWVREIADAAGSGSVVVLEPDALALGNRCALPVDRFRVLHEAVGTLADGPVTYVDAGHSRWLDADSVVSRLRRVGVERVRGFSLNVAGFGDEAGERAYGDRIVAGLAAGRAARPHYVVDTGRSGAGSDGQWCNPAGRALGPEPSAVLDQAAMDARLWIKPPGESDGRCSGGPEAGTFWSQRALEMARSAGW